MVAKKLDDYIVKEFKDLGFSDDEIKEGCWLLEKKVNDEKKPIAWIAYHKFLERVAIKAGIIFDKPEIFNLETNEIALFVNGKKGELSAWAIGEASVLNLSPISKAYRWAMAEKRAKDRVVLKLLGIAGDVYSEEESDEFKNVKIDFEKDASKLQAQQTKETNKQIKADKNSPEGLKERYESCKKFLDKLPMFTDCGSTAYKQSRQLVEDLTNGGMIPQSVELEDMINQRMPKIDDSIPTFED